MKMKKLLCAFLTLCMVFAMLPLGVMAAENIGSGSCGTDVSWVLTDDGVLTISGTGEMKDYKMKLNDSTAPWFKYAGQIKTVVIEPGVTDIGNYAFYNCQAITSVSLPEGLKTLGASSFYGCTAVEAITLPESLEEIGPAAMYRMTSLTELTIPAATTVIGEDAVIRLHSLKRFQVASGNPSFSSDESGTLYNKDQTALIACPGAYEGAYVIPDGVTTVEREAFDTCLGVTEIEIPASMVELKMMAFTFCKNLHKIHFKGDAPTMSGDIFNCLNTVVYYPAGNATWTEDVMHYYSGDIVLWEAVGDCVHTADEGVVTQAPACETPGYMTYTCTKCGADFYEILPGLDHNWDEGVRSEEYNCEEGGFMRYTCKDCEGYHDEELKPTDHIYGEGVVVAPTCTNQGYTQYICTVCGHVNSEDHVDALGHSYEVSEVVDPTCTDRGVTIYICSVCGNEEFGDYVDPTGHTYESEVTLEATCTDEGELTCTCTVCGDSYTEAIPALGHSWDEGLITAPTCTEDGYTTHTCTVCGETEMRDMVAALGHSWDEGVTTTHPTCTEEGITTYTCTACSDSYTEAFPALGHSHNDGEVTKEATCTETGIMSYVCTVCDTPFTEEIPLIPHDYVDGFCSVCGGAQMTVPTILSCYSKLQDSVKVTWTLSEGADGYELYRTTTPDADDSWAKVKTVTSGDTDRYTNQGLEVGTTYYYKVRAYAEDAEGNKTYTEFSNVDYMPAAVVFDGPYSNATFRIRLRWHEIGGAHGYQIWRLNEDGTYSIVKTLGDRGNELTDNQGATTAYSNTGLTAGETYTYKMRAFMITEDGRKVFGAYSDEYAVAVMPETPVVTGTSPKATRAQLSWEALNGAVGYQIWMAESADGEYKIVKSITDGTTTYTKYDLTSGKTYYFKVRAYTEVEGKKTFGAYSEVLGIKVQ